MAGNVKGGASFEGARVGIGCGKNMRLGEGAKGTPIPPSRDF